VKDIYGYAFAALPDFEYNGCRQLGGIGLGLKRFTLQQMTTLEVEYG
jgi:hypothetical protein